MLITDMINNEVVDSNYSVRRIYFDLKLLEPDDMFYIDCSIDESDEHIHAYKMKKIDEEGIYPASMHHTNQISWFYNTMLVE